MYSIIQKQLYNVPEYAVKTIQHDSTNGSYC